MNKNESDKDQQSGYYENIIGAIIMLWLLTIFLSELF